MTERDWAVVIYYLAVAALGTGAWFVLEAREKRAAARKSAAEAAEKPKA